MKILFVGDVVRQAGCDFLRRELPNLRRFYGADMTIVNGENAAEGNGILPGSAELILDAGADVITLGNHALRRREIYPMLEESDRIIRPANFHASAPGRGWCLYDCPGKPRVAVINLQGNYLLESHENAFDCMDRLLEEIDAPVKILDFHAGRPLRRSAWGCTWMDGSALSLGPIPISKRQTNGCCPAERPTLPTRGCVGYSIPRWGWRRSLPSGGSGPGCPPGLRA